MGRIGSSMALLKLITIFGLMVVAVSSKPGTCSEATDSACTKDVIAADSSALLQSRLDVKDGQSEVAAISAEDAEDAEAGEDDEDDEEDEDDEDEDEDEDEYEAAPAAALSHDVSG